ncbi:MAG: transcriptional repressor [Candidatus Cloacimonetes bacterium]|nr:transcriptional repressor [Candidatus Cloacimonadota bacterium]
MTQYRRIFAEFMKRRGAKITHGRGAILEAVFDNHGHFDVEELYEQLKSRGERVSLATLYRTIPLLVESGLVRQAMRTDATTRYEHVWGHPRHLHIVCKHCGKVVEVELGDMAETLRTLGRNHGYRVEEITLCLRGLCRPCRQKGESDVPA